MEPIDFKHSNKELQAPDEEATRQQYGDAVTDIVALPVWTDGIQCVSCWKMSWRERLSALLFGRCWVMVLSGSTQPPVWVDAEKEFLVEETPD